MSSPPDASASARLGRLVPGCVAPGSALAVALDRDAVWVTRPAGSVLFDEGSPCAGLLVLMDGAVKVSRVGPEGRELLLYRVTPGETCVLTVSCLLGHTHYPGRGVAEGAVNGVLIPAALFDRLVAESAAFRGFVFHAFSDRVGSLVDLAAAVAFENLDRRLARALLARVTLSGRIALELTHQELADELGTVRERVSRLLEGFAERGIVELGRGRLIVRDRSKLEAQAGGGA